MTALLTAGVACVVAGIIGGGLKAWGMEIPALQSGRRQVALAFFGFLLMATAGIVRLLEISQGPKPQQAPTSGSSTVTSHEGKPESGSDHPDSPKKTESPSPTEATNEPNRTPVAQRAIPTVKRVQVPKIGTEKSMSGQSSRQLLEGILEAAAEIDRRFGPGIYESSIHDALAAFVDAWKYQSCAVPCSASNENEFHGTAS